MKLSLLRNSSFKIIFEKEIDELELNIVECNIPGLSLGEIQWNYNSLGYKSPGDSLTFNNLSLSVLCDNNLDTLKKVLKHIFTIKDPETGEIEIHKTPFTSVLHILTNKGNFNKKIIFYDCWIQNISDIQLTTLNNEDEVITFNLDIIFSYYVIE